jgi:RNA-directed DNA polymerase
MRPWSPHRYKAEGIERGVPEHTLTAAIAAYERVLSVSEELTPVLTLRHLCKLAGASYAFQRAVIARTNSPYFTFEIDKRGPSARRAVNRRLIAVPDHRLRNVQSWICQAILRHMPAASHSFAYHPGGSIVRCAQRHCGCRWLMKMDIADFFQSIREHHVYRVFRSLGYGPLISFEMARLCTMQPVRHEERDVGLVRRRAGIAAYGPRYPGHLPMGAPTSPMISNLFMREFDRVIARMCAAQGVIYSRYADDLVMSTDDPNFTRANAVNLLRECRQMMRRHGMRPQEAKFSIVPPGARKVVLGIVVNDREPKLPKEFKSRLRQHYYYIDKYGMLEHAKQRNFYSVPALQRHLEGLLAYAAQVEPTYARRMRSIHNSFAWPRLL